MRIAYMHFVFGIKIYFIIREIKKWTQRAKEICCNNDSNGQRNRETNRERKKGIGNDKKLKKQTGKERWKKKNISKK